MTDPPAGTVRRQDLPRSPLAWIFATAAAVLFALVGLLPDTPDDALNVTPAEYAELRDVTIFLITALLPSDAAIRFGRGLLFRTIGNAEEAAARAPRATLPQILAFGAFLVLVGAAIADDTLITGEEFRAINDVVRHLVIVLLPSEAAIRVGRALYLRGSERVAPELARRI